MITMRFVRHVVRFFMLRDNNYVRDLSSIAWVEFKFGVAACRLPILSSSERVADGGLSRKPEVVGGQCAAVPHS